MTEYAILWDREKLARFKKAYQRATELNSYAFEFEGHKFLTAYAYYLIEYLEGQPL